MKRRALFVGSGLAAAAAGLGLSWWQMESARPGASDAQGLDPWALRFARPEGGELEMAPLRGRPLVLNFWATWCPPCTEEMPSLERMAAALEGSGISTLAVSVDESWNEVKAFFAQGTKLGVLLDASKEVPKKYTTEKYPETFLIDAQGRVRHYFISKRDWSRPEAIACLESLR